MITLVSFLILSTLAFPQRVKRGNRIGLVLATAQYCTSWMLVIGLQWSAFVAFLVHQRGSGDQLHLDLTTHAISKWLRQFMETGLNMGGWWSSIPSVV